MHHQATYDRTLTGRLITTRILHLPGYITGPAADWRHPENWGYVNVRLEANPTITVEYHINQLTISNRWHGDHTQ